MQNILTYCKSTNTALVAASKTQHPEKIAEAYQSGITHFGENYLDEALEKIKSLSEFNITWHFIGAIQSRKCTDIALNFDWVQTIDREKVANKLSAAIDDLPPDSPKHGKTLNCLIQVNIDNEPQKAGVHPDEIFELACKIQKLPHLHLKGLMVIPKPRDNVDEQHSCFQKVKTLFDTLKEQGFDVDTLSMGMSNDYQIAIETGSTMVRIGTKIFGQRST